jgi:hypothetical protein
MGMDSELLEAVSQLSRALMVTRAEIDSQRILLAGVLEHLVHDPARRLALAAAIRGAVEADAAASIASKMTDDMLQLRRDLVYALLPAQLAPLVLPTDD